MGKDELSLFLMYIYSSLLKGIRSKGLRSTDVRTNRGAKIDDITYVISNMDLSPYKTIILHVGGNDLSSGSDLQTINTDYESLLYAIRAESNQDTVIIISGVPPRRNVDVQPLNHLLEELCDYFNLYFVNHYDKFCDQYGNVNSSLFHSDGIHLSQKGTSLFLKNLNSVIPLLKHQENSLNYCRLCGENGHSTSRCRHENALKCFRCFNFGHKEKLCDLYSR